MSKRMVSPRSLSPALTATLLCLLMAGSWGQQPGTNVADNRPALPLQSCDAGGTCTSEATTVVLDQNWRWLRGLGGYSNCYTGTSWDAKFCPDPETCAKNCALEGADYEATYLVSTQGKELSLGYVASGGNVGSRTYLMAATPPPTKHAYTTYASKNCYGGHGGTEIDSQGVPGLTAEQCKTRCDADAACSCVTYQPSATTCWKRGSCVPAQFADGGSGYDVYVKQETSSSGSDDSGGSSSSGKYRMFKLLNREFSFEADVSTLPCGLNGALYFVEMDEDGGMARWEGNKAGADFGTGYCDAQCPHDAKFINGEANILGWNATTALGRYGTCCTEMDIFESNSIATALTPHTCSVDGQTRCDNIKVSCGDGGQRFDGVCDADGCDFNAWRVGDRTFYGPGPAFTIDTTKPFTVTTAFVTADGTDDGDLVEIRRSFTQNGKTVPFPAAKLVDGTSSSITQGFCAKSKTAFNDTDAFTKRGGMKRMGDVLRRGMVLVFSLWDDAAAHMLWLDSDDPPTGDDSTPGVSRGSCPTTSGDPDVVRKSHPGAYVKYGNLRVGPISAAPPSPGPGPPTPTPPAPVPPTPGPGPGPSPSGCPGGSLRACIDLCPSDPPAAYKACVTTCSKRCA